MKEQAVWVDSQSQQHTQEVRCLALSGPANLVEPKIVPLPWVPPHLQHRPLHCCCLLVDELCAASLAWAPINGSEDR